VSGFVNIPICFLGVLKEPEHTLFLVKAFLHNVDTSLLPGYNLLLIHPHTMASRPVAFGIPYLLAYGALRADTNIHTHAADRADRILPVLLLDHFVGATGWEVPPEN